MKKIKYVPQMLQTECGLCCVTMIANYYKHYVTVGKLRNYQQPGREGVSARDICQMLKWIQFEYKIYNCETSKLRDIHAPVIAYWNKSHFVVIEKVTSKKIYIVDPAYGRMIYSLEEFEKNFSNVIILPYPSKNITLEKKVKSIWLEFVPVFFKDKALIVSLLLFSCFSYLFSLFIPNFIRYIIDSSGKNSLTIFSIGVAILFGYTAVYFINALLGILLKTEVYQIFYKKIFGKLKNVEYRYFENRSAGNITYSLNSVAKVNDFYAGYLVTSLVSLGASAVLLIYYANVSIKAFAFLAAGILLFGISYIILNRRTVRLNQEEISSEAKLSSIQTEFISSIESIKICGFEDTLFKQWEEVFDKSIVKKRQSEKARVSSGILLNIMTIALPMFMLYILLFMSENGDMSIGMSVSLYSVASIIVNHVVTVFTSLGYVELTNNYLNRLQDIILQEEEQNGLKELDKVSYIEMKNVDFSYNKNSPIVLKNINMKFYEGKKIAIVGESGSGKSTIAKLLIKLYLPKEGEIFYDGLDYNSIKNESLRKKISFVPQVGKIFNKTIRDNLTMLNDNVSEDELIAVCQEINLFDEIVQMPMKFDTVLSEQGLNLSGGQRQKILIGRALLSDANFLVLDEATSSMDFISEQIIYEALRRRNCTQIIITHRLSTIADADYIYVIKKGEVVEEGIHADLMNQKGEYFSVFRRKNREKNTERCY